MSNPTPESVNSFHINSDLDVGDLSGHHTLGYGQGQAAPGLAVSRRLKAIEFSDTDYVGMRVCMSVAQTIPTTLTTFTSWDLNNTTPGIAGGIPMKGIVESAGTFIIQEPGLYFVQFQCTFSSTTTARKYIDLFINGSDSTTRLDTNPTGVTQLVTLRCQDFFFFGNGDSIQPRATSSVSAVSGSTTQCLTIMKVK